MTLLPECHLANGSQVAGCMTAFSDIQGGVLRAQATPHRTSLSKLRSYQTQLYSLPQRPI